MGEPAMEGYEINNKDPELHVIDVITKAVNYHLLKPNDGPQSDEENLLRLRQAERVLRYSLHRIEDEISRAS